MTETEKRAGWTVSGSHVVLPVEMVEQLQEALDNLMYARRAGKLLTEDRALETLDRVINDEIGQPATRAAG